jgi:hypothetical protein
MRGEDLACPVCPVARVENKHGAPTFSFLFDVDEARIQQFVKSSCGIVRAAEGDQEGGARAEPTPEVSRRTFVVHNVSIAGPTEWRWAPHLLKASRKLIGSQLRTPRCLLCEPCLPHERAGDCAELSARMVAATTHGAVRQVPTCGSCAHLCRGFRRHPLALRSPVVLTDPSRPNRKCRGSPQNADARIRPPR